MRDWGAISRVCDLGRFHASVTRGDFTRVRHMFRPRLRSIVLRAINNATNKQTGAERRLRSGPAAGADREDDQAVGHQW